MAKYNVGDKVRVRKDLDLGERYFMADRTRGLTVTASMTRLAGKTVTISKIDHCGHYNIKEDPDKWCWTDEMFETKSESKHEFKVGDRVRITAPTDDKENIVGKIGTIVSINNVNAGVEFDEYIDGHSSSGSGKAGYCWNCRVRTLEFVKTSEKIVITTDGRITTAKLISGNKTIKTATAKCSPDDTFDFNVGAMLAFDRLTKIEFKVGDRVVAKKGAPYGITTNGWKGKVIAVNKDSDLDIKVRSETSFNEYWVDSKWFDLVTESEPKFKVGEFVKVTHSRDIHHYFPIGSIVEIKIVKDDRLICYGLTNNGGHSFCEQTVSIKDVEKL